MKQISHVQLSSLCGGYKCSASSSSYSSSAQPGLAQMILNGVWFSVSEYAVMSCLQWVYDKVHAPKKKTLTAEEKAEQGDQPCDPAPEQYSPRREYCSGGFEVRY